MILLTELITIYFLLCFSSVAGNEQWQNLISHLLNECFCTADIVAPVVTSSSPEGFMVDDNEGKYLYTLSVKNQVTMILSWININKSIQITCAKCVRKQRQWQPWKHLANFKYSTILCKSNQIPFFVPMNLRANFQVNHNALSSKNSMKICKVDRKFEVSKFQVSKIVMVIC